MACGKHNTKTLQEIHAFRELRWQAHSKGLVQLLFARGPQCMTEDMSRSLFYAALTHDVGFE